MSIRVAMVEDDEGYRTALVAILNGTPGFRCVGDAATAEEAWEQFRLPIDVVLVDIRLPGQSGIELVRGLRDRFPDTHCIMLTVFEDAQRLFQSLAAGAGGYLLKRTPPAEILLGIQEVVAGGAPMSRAIARKVIQHFHSAERAAQAVALLTPREREVLDQLATGHTYKEIASTAGISLETVKAHLRGIYRKLHVTSRTGAVLKLLGR